MHYGGTAGWGAGLSYWRTFMDWMAVIPAACGAVIGGALSFLGGSWQANRAATRQRQSEILRRSEDSAAEALSILHDIRTTAENHPDEGGSWPNFWLSRRGTDLVRTRLTELERAARLITDLELRTRIESAASYLEAPQEFQHLEGEALATTARRLETWISDNVTAYLTDEILPKTPDYVASYQASYQEACAMAEEAWESQEQWRKEERDRIFKEREQKNATEA